MSVRSELIEAIFRLNPRDGQYSIESVAILASQSVLMGSDLEREEYISKYKRTLFSDLLKRQEVIHNRGGLKTFDIVSVGAMRLSWVPSSAKSRKHRDNLIRRSCVARWLDDLDDRSYEFACALAMESLGALRVYVSPPGNEFGFDFLALIPAHTRSSLFVSGSRGVRVLGQAKKYSSPVPREKIQSFNDLVTSVKNNRAELIPLVPAWFRSSDSPILTCYVGHSGFQSGSLEMMRQSGHIALDTLALAGIISKPSIVYDFADQITVQRILWARLRALGFAK